jgi:general stress protein CsbA
MKFEVNPELEYEVKFWIIMLIVFSLLKGLSFVLKPYSDIDLIKERLKKKELEKLDKES